MCADDSTVTVDNGIGVAYDIWGDDYYYNCERTGTLVPKTQQVTYNNHIFCDRHQILVFKLVTIEFFRFQTLDFVKLYV